MLRSRLSKIANGFSPGLLASLNTVAGDPVPAKTVPFLSTARDHTKVEGVVASSVSPGPWRRWPSLSMETPAGVPFSNSSICDCCQRCVPCADKRTPVRHVAAAKVTKRTMEICEGWERFKRWGNGDILPLSLLEFSVWKRTSDNPAPRSRLAPPTCGKTDTQFARSREHPPFRGIGRQAILGPKYSICVCYRELAHKFDRVDRSFDLINTTFAQAACSGYLSAFWCCQSYFRGTSIPVSLGSPFHGLLNRSPLCMQLFPGSKSFINQRHLIVLVCADGVSRHGMVCLLHR